MMNHRVISCGLSVALHGVLGAVLWGATDHTREAPRLAAGQSAVIRAALPVSSPADMVVVGSARVEDSPVSEERVSEFENVCVDHPPEDFQDAQTREPAVENDHLRGRWIAGEVIAKENPHPQQRAGSGRESGIQPPAPGPVAVVLPPYATVVTSAKVVSHVEPEYPALARRRSWEGAVVVEVRVDERGLALGAAVAESSGRDVLDDAALRAARECAFQPATEDGVAVASTVRVTFRFVLQ